MTINRNNFEAYLLDYLEGNLNPLLTADLMAFLAENPEFEKYIPDYDSSLSLSAMQPYTQKNQLKKELSDLPEITPGNFDEFCIASCEGLLNEKDLSRLSDYISSHPEKQCDLDLYRKLRLQPDTALHYESKARLKKNHGPAIPRYLYYATGIAASFILLFLLVLRKPAGPVYTETQPANSVIREHVVQPSHASPSVPVAHENTPPAPIKKQQHVTLATGNQVISPVEETPASGSKNPAPAKLEPITKAQVFSPVQPPPVADRLAAVKRLNQKPGQTPVPDADSFADSRLGKLLRRIDYWKTAKTAISGFNYLTESELSVNRVTDESGKLSSLLIQSESYTITGKIK